MFGVAEYTEMSTLKTNPTTAASASFDNIEGSARNVFLIEGERRKGTKITFDKATIENHIRRIYQIMALNHLPSHQIEPTFRELCSQEFPLGDTNKKLKTKFQRYWEKFWFNTIGVERLSVYKAPLRTNNHCESYHAKLAKTIGIRPNFWVFIRNINRLLEINDIDIERILAETPMRRPRKPNENEKRIQNLVQRLETGQPTPTTPLDFVKAMAHLQTSKFKYNEDAHSESDSEEGEDGENEAVEQPPEEQPAEEQQVNRTECQICLMRPINAVLCPCMHTSCLDCGERLKREKLNCHMCRAIIRRVMRIHIN